MTLQPKNSIKIQVVNFLNNKNVRIGIEVAKELGNTVSAYSTNKSKWTLLSGTASVLMKFVDRNETSFWDFFDSWQVIFNRDFSQLVFETISEYEHEDIVMDENTLIRVHDLEGHKVGYQTSKKFLDQRTRIFVKPEDKEEVERIIRGKIWTRFKGSSMTVRRNKKLVTDVDEDRVIVEVDTTFQALNSATADEKTTLYRKWNELNITRTLLLYGPPGTGKSTMARTIVNNLGYRSLRVRLRDISDIDGSILMECIRIFNPDALILDDLDRAMCQDELLETFEVLHGAVKLVIATANNTSRFDKAVLRPGRFDDIELIEKLDENVIKSVLGSENISLYNDVKDWPIVFIEDLKKRLLISGNKEYAQRSVKELAERVEYICNIAEYNELDTFVALSKNKNEESAKIEEAMVELNRRRHEAESNGLSISYKF